MKYAIILGFAALAVALPQYGGNRNGGGRDDYGPASSNYGPASSNYGPAGGNYGPAGGNYGPAGGNYGPSGIAGTIAGEISYDISKGISTGISTGIEKGIECAFTDRYRCKNVAGQEVPVPENLEAKSDIARRQGFGNLFGGNRPGVEAEETEEVESEIETEGETIPVLEIPAGAQVAPPTQGFAPFAEE
ncbi:hypothetical protein EG328_006449 [Venturia inaequalis]|uniref:Uncharacterized protein n=1 Tax=Venturia inaequalis TaxID=5025 RepID=A0A8H3YSD1_VENIN|nr:hypothetical protein EG328_006449 [Venturia inaequalis]